jgi:hypothetical protein
MGRKPDNKEEAYLLDRLREIYGDLAVKPRAIGGDAQTPHHQWEHKYRSTSGFTVQKDHWDKISARAAMERTRPVLVIKNKHQQRLAVLELDDLLELLTGWERWQKHLE